MPHNTARVALAHDHLFQMGGAELVLKELSNMFPSAPIYTLICDKRNISHFSNTKIITSMLQSFPGGISHFKWYLRLMPTAWEQFDFSNYDFVISSSSAFVKGIITSIQTKHICYCHTPTRYLWSDRIEYIDNLKIPSIVRLYLMSLLSKLRQWDQLAATRVDQFVANSQHVANRIQKYYNRDSLVIYPPVDTEKFLTDQSMGNYYLIVSRLRPYKRVGMAIEAFNQLRIPLVIIGAGEEINRLKRLAKKNITFLGEVSNADRNKYLARCKAFIHPQEEDFGISAVEAMASGRPVIAYRAGGALETIVEGKTGLFFDDQSWESLLYAVLEFEKINFDARIIIDHAKKFDKSVFYEKMMQLLKKQWR